MELYTYHSPEGDRELVGEKSKSGLVDLFTATDDGKPLLNEANAKTLEIGKCPIGSAIGQCEPKEKPVAEKTDAHKK